MIRVECLRNKNKLLLDEDEFEWYAVEQSDLSSFWGKRVYTFYPEFYEKYKFPYYEGDLWVEIL